MVDSKHEMSKGNNTIDTFQKIELVAEKLIATNSYVLHLDGTLATQPKIAAALSNNSVDIISFENDQLCETAVLKEHAGLLVNVKFSTDNKNCLYTGSRDGVVKLWDLRTPEKSVLDFIDTTKEDDKKVKQFSCFDVSPNNKLLVVGTELCSGDAFLLFWDVRNSKLMGGYWESHTEDITEVKFHPEDSNKLISGSTDGLINVFDLSQTSEDDALVETFNTESSIDKLVWYKQHRFDAIACITHVHDLLLWNTEDSDAYARFTREDFTYAMQKVTIQETHVSQAHPYNNGLMVLAQFTESSQECTRSLLIDAKKLLPGFDLSKNKQLLRTSWCNPYVKLLVTGGEQGIVDVWKL